MTLYLFDENEGFSALKIQTCNNMLQSSQKNIKSIK